MMRRALRLLLGSGLIVAASWIVVCEGPTPANAEPAGAEVQLKLVKYEELAAAIKALRGKVVVVDIWADYCLPCKKAFPHLVEMHRKYAGQGLVCVSVSVDEPEKRAKALAFLQKQGATFANYLLTEEVEVWQQRWKVKAPPIVFVFSRDGRRAAKFDHDDPDKNFTYDEVENLVKQLLQPS